METMSRHPNRDNVRFVTQDRSAGTSSSSLRSPAWTEDDKDSVVDNPQSDLELAIPIERKHVVNGRADHLTREKLTARSAYGGANSETGKRLMPVQHMWWNGDDEQSSSLVSSSAGEGPRFISSDEGEETRNVANIKKPNKEKTGARTVAQGSDGAVAQILHSAAHLPASEPGSTSLGSPSHLGGSPFSERAEKPRKQKKPELNQRTKPAYNFRECVILDIAKAILNNPGPDNSDSDKEQVQVQKVQGKPNIDLSQFVALSQEELVSIVPRCGEGQPSSIGSMLHATKACQTCVFANMKSNCQHGVYCLYCHLKHNSKQRNTRRVMKIRSRERLRKQVDRLCQQVESDLSLDLDALEMPSSLYDWADVVKTKLRSYQQGLRTQRPKLSL